jgi:hypothetical protein
MDATTQSRSRQPGAQPTSRPPARLVKDKKTNKDGVQRAVPGRIREAKDSSEIIRVPKRSNTVTSAKQSLDRPSTDDDPNARHFTVANVGRNGTLYLKPSRMQAPLPQVPPTPPAAVADSRDDAFRDWNRRPSAMSGTWTPKLPPDARGSKMNTTIPLPPLSMANIHDHRRTRSHSFSTVDGSHRTPTFDTNDFQILLNGRETTRPKSSVDLTEDILNMRIPHYRLGTPRFSERGTAYLHNSVYTSTSDLRSSVFSRADYDKLFPAPPGLEQGALRRGSSPYLHPAHATTVSLSPSRTPPTPTAASPATDISPAVYDKVEARINDATLVRYSPTTGRIIAATPARLIAQISSPLFLDYELLADFFLTFRNFLTCSQLLEYMLARMKWALVNDSDAGRIVRVRTFVALRHWILNYFADDFIPILSLRQRFCDLVNELTKTLKARTDQGGTDMNVIGELKKCWRRTCAKFWPVPDALDASADVDILPGHEPGTSGFGASSTSLPLSVRPRNSQFDFRRSSIIQLPPDIEKEDKINPTPAIGLESPATPAKRVRTASIPTSPMSEDSLTVLSCSVPFLKHLMDSYKQPRPPGPRRNPPLAKALEAGRRPTHAHKRSGSFSDALRDRRPPLPSTEPDSIDIRSLQSMTFTGGLVRGLLLQPCPSKMDLLIPLSPPIAAQGNHEGGVNEGYFDDSQYSGVGMRRIVGDVRRALSNRGRGRHESPESSQHSTNSSDSQISGRTPHAESSHGIPGAWQQLGGPPRIDMLAEKIETVYQKTFNVDPNSAGPGETKAGADAQDRHADDEMDVEFRRKNSQFTTGSRSIVIVDDTGIPDMPNPLGALPSISSWSSGMAPQPLFKTPQTVFEEPPRTKSADARSGSLTAVASPGSEPQLHDLLAVPDDWASEAHNDDAPFRYRSARKSSSVHPSAIELQPIRNQLRRRPGGDLKAADHVHDLEPVPRHAHGDSYSTITRSMGSDATSNDLHGTHFSGQGYKGWEISNSFAEWDTEKGLLPTGSSQVNMRPSFQRQVSHLKKLPDGANQDGGIEDALARLEGKESNMTLNQSAAADRPTDSVMPPPHTKGPRSSSLQFARVPAPGRQQYSTEGSAVLSPRTDRQGASIYMMSDSEDGKLDPPKSVLRAMNPDSPTTATSDGCAIESVDFAEFQQKAEHANEEESDRSGKTESPTAARTDTSQGSFLLDDNESLSDISTEIAESGDESLGVRSFFFDDTPADELPGTSFRAPPTPPSTVAPTTNPSSTTEASPIGNVPARIPEKRTLKEAASAPRLTPAARKELQFNEEPSELRRTRTSPARQAVAHLPFVLAFESDVIAEQLTIIEKDALDEVEWKDLVSLSWQQSPPHVRNWVEFLKQESNGIDIVIARFNLVVKWVVSECLLTEAPSERARCINKFIHIAAHCHRLRNYASMYQITLALLSVDMARLHQTWNLVPPSEKGMLDQLEKLCQPLKNFHNLRSEMESASESDGCIPFIGLYTHDLMFNAQKPAHIDAMPPGKERLINFERYQTAAMIVKSLLRLIESSSNYVFRPHPEVLSRCLWLASLDDGEITARSKTLET